MRRRTAREMGIFYTSYFILHSLFLDEEQGEEADSWRNERIDARPVSELALRADLAEYS